MLGFNSSVGPRAIGRWLVAAVTACVLYGVFLFQAGPYGELRTAFGGDLPEERFGQSGADVQKAIGKLNAEQRSRYAVFQAMDVVNALLTCVALTLAILFAFRILLAPGSALWHLAWLPAILCAVDLAEDCVLFLLTRAEVPISPASIAAALTTAKLAVGSVAIPAAAVSLIAAGVRTLFARLSARTS